jgi:hypothetical protein
MTPSSSHSPPNCFRLSGRLAGLDLHPLEIVEVYGIRINDTAETGQGAKKPSGGVDSQELATPPQSQCGAGPDQRVIDRRAAAEMWRHFQIFGLEPARQGVNAPARWRGVGLRMKKAGPTRMGRVGPDVPGLTLSVDACQTTVFSDRRRVS